MFYFCAMNSIVNKLDKLDYQILRYLQEDGRISNLDLSQKIGLSPGPTLERVKKLEKKGLILGYHARLNGSKLNLGVSVFIQVSLSRQLDRVMDRFHTRILEIPQVMECYQVTGNADFMLRVVVADIPALEHLISNVFSKMEEIGHLQTSLIISEKKVSHKLPLEY